MEVKSHIRSESNSILSLISRLDRLDSTINNLESKKWSSARWGSGGVIRDVKRKCVPLDWAVKDAQSKGSILDRITSLEQRLYKLCLEMESKIESPSKNSEVEKQPKSSSRTKVGLLFSNSFSRFRSNVASSPQP